MYQVVSEFKEMFLSLNTLIPIKVLNHIIVEIPTYYSYVKPISII